MTKKPSCPVCRSLLKNSHIHGDWHFYECPRCGPYKLSGSADATIEHLLARDPKWPAILSHAIYKAVQGTSWPPFDSMQIQAIVENGALPSPLEQLNNLVQWIGRSQTSYGKWVIQTKATMAAVGSFDEESLAFVEGYAKSKGLIESSSVLAGSNEYLSNYRLTYDGWNHLDSMNRGLTNSRMAFMAMQFNDPEVESVYRNHFKPAVTQTGFTLKRLDEGQPAGLIDDRLRVEIRQARFMIADITLQNRGAYWEAGYAEGLGKPVIYSCRKDVFDAKGGVHFDTNHHLTVLWEPNNMVQAVARLKDTIRATFPGDTSMEV